jgi:hypothetical protein
MQRINKQTTTPFGLAFIFLGLAIVPVSLKAVGVNISFAPSANAFANAWTRITGGAPSAYQPLGTIELSALNIFDCCTDSTPVEEPVDQPCEIACLEEGGAPADCEQTDKATDVTPVSSLEPKCQGETSVPRLVAIAKRNAVASFNNAGRSGRKFEFNVIDVESIAEPIVASQIELASLVEKRIARVRFQMKNLKGIESLKKMKVLFEAPPSTLFDRDSRRNVRSEKDCDSSAKPGRLRTVAPAPVVVVERTETRGA